MSAEPTTPASPMPLSPQEHKSTFFRQSGWLMIAGVGSGAFMWAVHFLSRIVSEGEYRTFGVLMAVTMCIPAMPLQMVFAQQTAAALAAHRQRQLAGMIRLAWIGSFALWLAAALVLLPFHQQILDRWHIANPAAVWVTLLVLLFSIWMPLFGGVMQGQQSFLWLGWSSILNGVGRVGGAALIVYLLTGGAVSIMVGVLLGLGASVGIGVWQTRQLWCEHAEPFDRRALLGQIVPLMLGFGATQFLFTADTMFVNTYLPEHAAYYIAAGTLSRALFWLVAPITNVMFPKIVHSVVRAEKTDLMGLTLLCTAVIAGLGVLGLWLLGAWVVPLVYPPGYVAVATMLLPWYAGAMLPLCLANVLVNNLLAKSEFRIVPVLILLAVAYGLVLANYHRSLVSVLQTLGAFNLTLLLVSVGFTWGIKPRNPSPATATAASS
jgi:O-antigen/teichoic acid export membrane protein